MIKHFSICVVFVVIGLNYLFSQGIIIDHTCTDLPQIPLDRIDSAQANQKWHYAHTSHGSQLITGLNRIENDDPTYDVTKFNSALPNVPGSLCIFDGQEGGTYITPEDYWKTNAGMNLTRDVLNNNPTINVSQWSWCTQLNYYPAAELQLYFDSISVLEAEFPQVTFVYMTGNAQTGPGNHYNQNLAEGYNRYLRNEQIRNFCTVNNKILFDFADIECWWYNPSTEEWEYSTYEYWNGSDTITVPFEHPQYNLNQTGHTSYENAENKGKAVWWLMAALAGWENGFNLDLKVFLEGPFNGVDMNTDLTDLSVLPTQQPYNIPPWNYSGTESVSTIPIPDITDWILVELRDATSAALATSETAIARQAGFLLNDGSVAGLDGVSDLRFDISVSNQLYVVIYHRNHLAVMSANSLNELSGTYIYDFTIGANQVYNGEIGYKNLGGVWGMVAGDGNGDGLVDEADKTFWSTEAGTFGYYLPDYSFDAQVDNHDKDKAWLLNTGKECQVPD